MLPCGLITRPVVQSISSLLWPSSFVARLYAPVIPITLLAASADPPRVLLISPRCLITRLAALVTFPYYLKSSLPIRSLFLVSTAFLSLCCPISLRSRNTFAGFLFCASLEVSPRETSLQIQATILTKASLGYKFFYIKY